MDSRQLPEILGQRPAIGPILERKTRQPIGPRFCYEAKNLIAFADAYGGLLMRPNPSDPPGPLVLVSIRWTRTKIPSLLYRASPKLGCLLLHWLHRLGHFSAICPWGLAWSRGTNFGSQHEEVCALTEALPAWLRLQIPGIWVVPVLHSRIVSIFVRHSINLGSWLRSTERTDRESRESISLHLTGFDFQSSCWRCHSFNDGIAFQDYPWPLSIVDPR